MDGTAAVSTPSGSTTTGPASFSELPSTAWSGDSSTPTPTSESTPADSASAATTEPPAATATPEGTTPAAGEPPKERWADILANARTKAAEEALAPIAWAKDVNPQEFQQLRSIAKHFASGDTMGGLKALLAEARKDPKVDAQLRSEAARILAQRHQQPESAAPQMVNVQLEDGTVVAMPRDPSSWLASQKQQWLDELRQEMQPVTQTVQSLQQREAEAVRQQQITHFVSSTFQDMASWPGMDTDTNRQLVAQELARAQVDPNNPTEVLLAAERAWRTHVAPQASRQAEAKLLDSLKTKAVASTGVNPGSAAPSASRAVVKFTDLPPDAWR